MKRLRRGFTTRYLEITMFKYYKVIRVGHLCFFVMNPHRIAGPSGSRWHIAFAKTPVVKGTIFTFGWMFPKP